MVIDRTQDEQYEVYFKLVHPDVLDINMKTDRQKDRPPKHNLTSPFYASLDMKSPHDFCQYSFIKSNSNTHEGAPIRGHEGPDGGRGSRGTALLFLDLGT